MKRVIARTLARELTSVELERISGADTGNSSSYCGMNEPTGATHIDDSDADFIEPIVVGP